MKKMLGYLQPSSSQEFLDFISVALTGSDLLMNIDYETVALSNTEKDTLYVRVSGDASSILEMADDE